MHTLKEQEKGKKLQSGAHANAPADFMAAVESQLEVPGKLHSGVPIQQTPEQAPASKQQKRK